MSEKTPLRRLVGDLNAEIEELEEVRDTLDAIDESAASENDFEDSHPMSELVFDVAHRLHEIGMVAEVPDDAEVTTDAGPIRGQCSVDHRFPEPDVSEWIEDAEGDDEDAEYLDLQRFEGIRDHEPSLMLELLLQKQREKVTETEDDHDD